MEVCVIGQRKIGQQTAKQLELLGHNVVLVGLSKVAQGVPGASFIFICLDTLPEIESAAFEVGKHVSHNAFVIVHGKLSIGISRVVKDLVDQGIENSGRQTMLVNVVTASSPVIKDRVVIWVDQIWAGDLIMGLYKEASLEKFVVGPEASELTSFSVQQFENMKQGFLLDLKNMAEQRGVDSEEVIKASGLD